MNSTTTSRDLGSSSLGFGAALAIAMSWTMNNSIFWAIVHGILGWVYVIYRALGYGV